MRVTRMTLAAVATTCLSLLIPTTAALGASQPAHGKVSVFVTPSLKQGPDRIVVTGAIGDYGKSFTVNKGGKPDAKGAYLKVALHKGSFLINLTNLEPKLHHLPVVVSVQTCSASVSETGHVSLSDGTGLYAGISGNLKLTVTVALVVPRFSNGPLKGQCNFGNNARPLAAYGSITGSGTVSF
jgi:hypothetical protein